MDKQGHYNQCLELFRNQKYAEALRKFHSHLDRDDLSDLDRLRTSPNVANCLLEMHWRKQAPPDWAEEFQVNLRGYFDLLDRVESQDIAPPPLRDYFAITLRFLMEAEPLDSIRDRARAMYGEFVKHAKGKLRHEEYIQTVLAEIERERRNYARPDHAKRAAELAEAVLQEIGDDDRFPMHRTAIYNLLADLAYFFPLSSEDDHQRYKRVSGYLEKALLASPHDDFARTFKGHVERFAATTLQIKRFGHDTKNRLANALGLLKRMESQLPAGSELHQTALALRREMHGLTVLGKLIDGQQAAKEDWAEIDPVEIIRSLLQERGWPDGCLQRVGIPAAWEFCPDYLRIALENMLRNTVEAYGRSGRELPAQPCCITVDYDQRTIAVRDWAGGIDLMLGDVFEPYVSSKGVRINTGLGLTQAREAVELQSPQFRLELSEPQPEDGAEFRIHIPCLT